MKSVTLTALLATLTIRLSSTLAAPAQQAPRYTSIPIQGLPTGNIICATSRESSTLTLSTLTAALHFPSASSAQITSVYFSSGANTTSHGAPAAGQVAYAAIGPNPNTPPQFPSVCNTYTMLYWVPLYAAGEQALGHDVAVYAVGDGMIYYCGVLTNSDNVVPNGFHQCNAA